jgi:5-hydroxyisourate hydrolase
MTMLSTHILDTMYGCPAVGVEVKLLTLSGEILYRGTSNADGRCADLPDLARGRYHLTFAIAPYFRAMGVNLPDPAFLDTVVIQFGISENEPHYHVPLLASPYAYSTYRGS